MNESQGLIDEMLKSINYMIQQAMSQTTKTYDGLIVGVGSNGKTKVKFNGEIYQITQYGQGIPLAGSMVKVIVPQGNMNLAFFFITGQGEVPRVLSWNGRVGAVVPQAGDYNYQQIVGLVDELNKKVTKAIVEGDLPPTDTKALWLDTSNKQQTYKVFAGEIEKVNELVMQAQAIPEPRETIVTSWKSRIGQVAPQDGDYDYTQIGGLQEQLNSKMVKPVVIGKTPPNNVNAVWVDISDVESAKAMTEQNILSASPTNEPDSRAVVQSVNGVISWNGRVGHVKSKYGDYDYKQVTGLVEELDKRPEAVAIASKLPIAETNLLWIDTTQ